MPLISIFYPIFFENKMASYTSIIWNYDWLLFFLSELSPSLWPEKNSDHWSLWSAAPKLSPSLDILYIAVITIACWKQRIGLSVIHISKFFHIIHRLARSLIECRFISLSIKYLIYFCLYLNWSCILVSDS